MLKGDLTTTPLAPLLISLADDDATGCLHISDAEGDEALIYFKGGLVYAVTVPGRRPQLGPKLVSSGALTPEALAEAMEVQRTELQGWKLGELLVHLGFVDQPVVEAFVREQVHDAVWDLIRWTEGRWRFRRNEKTREDVAPPMTVQELLENLRERGVEWEAISHVVHGPTAVPVLSARGGGAPETMLDADAWSMLCKIDGERSVAELARDCGYTLFEAGQVLVALVNAGLADIEEDVEPPALEVVLDGDEPYGASSALAAAFAQPSDLDDVDDEPALDAPVDVTVDAAPVSAIDELARLVSEVAATVTGGVEPGHETPSPAPLSAMDDDSFASSVGRVSAALADALGPAPANEDPFVVPDELRIRRVHKPKPTVRERTPEDERREALRAAAAAELAAAHALAEALRNEQETARAAEEEAARVAAEEAARVAAEEEARRLAEEEAARLAAEQEAARVAAEEAARLAAEEEAARLAAEQEAARVAAEEAARLAAEEETARVAAEEAARVAAEEEAARVAAEEAARVAAEEEARRLAEEEAARLAAEEEAARLAAEEAARLAAEQEAARVAAEEEARRLAEEEAARVAAEQEARQLAEEEAWAEYWAREAEELAQRQAEEARIAEAEAARLAAEKEAARLAAEEEARRVAAEEAARAAAEEEAERAAAEAAVREADDRERRSRAAALLSELATQSVTEDPTTSDDLNDSTDAHSVPAPAELEPVAAGVPFSAPAASREMADTAALLRELSSLGLDDDPPAAPTPPRAPSRPPAAPSAPAKKKKRGLFGL